MVVAYSASEPRSRDAIVFDRFGGPEVLQWRRLPSPARRPGTVRVRVVAATVQPTDLQMRAGAQADLMVGLRPPYVPGMEFAGVVDDAGDHGDGVESGTPVVGLIDPRTHDGGAYASEVVVPRQSIMRVRAGADLIAAGTVPLNGLTAWAALNALETPPGTWILVTGAAGAVGSYTVELGCAMGYQMMAVAAPEDVSWLRRIGSDVVISSGDTLAEQVRAIAPAGVDGLVDCARLGDPAARLVRAGGAIVNLRRDAVIRVPDRQLKFVSALRALGRPGWLGEVMARFESGRLTPRVADVVPAVQAADSHQRMERGGLRGRIVLRF